METISFRRAAKPRDWAIGLLVLLALGGILCACAFAFTEWDPAMFMMIVVDMLICYGLVGWIAFPKITLTPEGITLSVGRLVLRKIPARQVCTVVKRVDHHARNPIVYLSIVTIPAAQMEAKGEARLRRDPLIRDELRFRENKADWRDVCLATGMPKKKGLWMEYTPERQQLLQQMFPHSEYRVPKGYWKPPA